jgi:hypothetical protein
MNSSCTKRSHLGILHRDWIHSTSAAEILRENCVKTWKEGAQVKTGAGMGLEEWLETGWRNQVL